MDRILDAVFDLAIWPIITCLSIFKYSLRSYYHSTPLHLRTLRVFLKTGLGWTAIYLLAGAVLFGNKVEEGIILGDPIKIISNRSFALVTAIILTIVPFLLVNWFALGWRRLRNRVLIMAVVRDAALIAWSGYFLVFMIFSIVVRVVFGADAFSGHYPFDNQTTWKLMFSLLLGLLIINCRVAHVVTTKYARSAPTWRVIIPSNILSVFISFIILLVLAAVNTFINSLKM